MTKGPRLGAGGLTRAYGAAARAVLEAAPKAPVVAQATVTVEAPLARYGALQGVLARRADDGISREIPDQAAANAGEGGGGADEGMMARASDASAAASGSTASSTASQ